MSTKHRWASVKLDDDQLEGVRRYVQARIFGNHKRFTKRGALEYLLQSEVFSVLSQLNEEEEESAMLAEEED